MLNYIFRGVSLRIMTAIVAPSLWSRVSRRAHSHKSWVTYIDSLSISYISRQVFARGFYIQSNWSSQQSLQYILQHSLLLHILETALHVPDVVTSYHWRIFCYSTSGLAAWVLFDSCRRSYFDSVWETSTGHTASSTSLPRDISTLAPEIRRNIKTLRCAQSHSLRIPLYIRNIILFLSSFAYPDSSSVHNNLFSCSEILCCW
jgi:hypothetical protein